jgi:ATP-dependent Clp protease adaptor protein ClpS
MCGVTLAHYNQLKTMSKTEIKTTIKPNLNLAEPPLFKIIYLNDDVTSMEFVVSSLIEYFNYTDDTAAHITESIHSNGSAVVAVLPYEIAEQKGIEVTVSARSQGYPLQVKVESEAT